MRKHPERLRTRAPGSLENHDTSGVFPTDRAVEETESLPSPDLGTWLEENQEALAARWQVELRSRTEEMDDAVLDLIGELLRVLTSLLAPGLGAFRAQAEDVLQQAAELYGNLGAHRGLAAGEAVEELQILREVVLRLLHGAVQDQAVELGLRELVQVNRLVDRGVTYVSIGHTDTLFFSLLHGTGVSGAPTQELLGAVREQVAAIRDEMAGLLPADRK